MSGSTASPHSEMTDRSPPPLLIYYDPRFLEHDTGAHPERAARLPPVIARLRAMPLGERCQWVSQWPSIAAPRLARVHSPSYVAAVKEFAASGGGHLDADTVASSRSFDVATLAAGAVCDAVERVVAGTPVAPNATPSTKALCLVRPPGHHALESRAMGFCLFNNVAIGARLATEELQLDRVLIVDWDVHHGNGTQATFWTDPRVGFLSIHRWPFYPGTGDADETGAGPGLGTTRNLPIPFGTPRREYIARLADELNEFADRLRPELMIVSAGFDSHRLDPIGSLGLATEDFGEVTRIVRAVADSHAGGRLVSVLEGGYNPAALADSLAEHVTGLVIE